MYFVGNSGVKREVARAACLEPSITLTSQHVSTPWPRMTIWNVQALRSSAALTETRESCPTSLQ